MTTNQPPVSTPVAVFFPGTTTIADLARIAHMLNCRVHVKGNGIYLLPEQQQVQGGYQPRAYTPGIQPCAQISK